jgi:hypothetical protein
LSSAALAAAAPTPTAYRAELNAICRANTVKLHQLVGRMAASRKAGDERAFAFALGEYFGLGLREDATIERAPVPMALRSQMAPVVSVLRQADGHVRAVLAAIANGDRTNVQSELKAVVSLSGTINQGLDAAGLRDCGSNQN